MSKWLEQLGHIVRADQNTEIRTFLNIEGFKNILPKLALLMVTVSSQNLVYKIPLVLKSKTKNNWEAKNLKGRLIQLFIGKRNWNQEPRGPFCYTSP